MVEEISAAELNKKIMSREKIIILDVRDEDDYNEGHIPGAIHTDMEKMQDIIGSAQGEIIVVCYRGGRSDSVCHYLRDNRLDAKSLRGGMASWGSCGFPLKK